MKKLMRLFGFRNGHRTAGSVRNRLYLLLIAVLVPVLGVQAAIYVNYLHTSTQQELTANLEVAHAVAGTFRGFIDDVLRQEFAIGTAILYLDSFDQGAQSRILRTNRDMYPVVQDFHWVDPSGLITASSRPEAVGISLADLPYLRKLFQEKAWTVSNLLRARPTGEAVFTISRAFLSQSGVLVGAVVAAIEADRLSDVLSVLRGRGGDVMVIDHEGRVVYRFPEIPWTWEKRSLVVNDPAVVKSIEGEEVTGIDKRGPDRGKRIYAMTPIPLFGWVVMASIPLSDVVSATLRDLSKQTILFLITVVCAIVAAFFIARTISEPLVRLRRETLSDDPSSIPRFTVGGPLEVRDLATALQGAFSELENVQTMLEDSNRKLERRVADRTRQLARLNEELRNEIAEHMKTEADLQSQRMKLLTYQEQLRALAIDLISTAEKERKQVATELHDGIGQALAVSKMKLDLLHSAAPSRALKKQAHEISLILDRIIENTRELVFELHPPVLHLYGLGAAVKWLAGMLEEQYGLRVEVTLHGREDGLNEELRILLFRTIRELLMNAVKHARTDSAGVVIRCRSDEISASVEDQGAGFDVSGEMRSQGFGLFSIREQLERLGGSVTIRSRSGHGTCVALSLPLQSAEGGNLSSE